MLTVNNNSKFHFEPDYRDETGMEQECGGNCNYAVQCEAPDGRTGIKQSWTHRNTDEVGSELHTRNPPYDNYNRMINNFNINKQKASNKKIFLEKNEAK